MKELTILWGIFSSLFFILAVFHFWLSTKKVQHFSVTRLTGEQNGIPIYINAGHDNIDRPTIEIETQINSFVDEFNSNNTWVNIAQGIGYSIALLTSLVSAWLTL